MAGLLRGLLFFQTAHSKCGETAEMPDAKALEKLEKKMTAIDTNRLPARNGNGLFSRLFDAIAAWNDLRVTRNALAKLSDRELADIGLTRFDAENLSH